MEYKIIILRADIDEEDTLPDKDTDEIWKGEVFNQVERKRVVKEEQRERERQEQKQTHNDKRKKEELASYNK